uniref:Uncharacterized protein n=1 Tax=Anopheles atroparvus TaxID=41427 RepID=A0A182IVT3_ANOAO
MWFGQPQEWFMHGENYIKDRGCAAARSLSSATTDSIFGSAAMLLLLVVLVFSIGCSGFFGGHWCEIGISFLSASVASPPLATLDMTIFFPCSDNDSFIPPFMRIHIEALFCIPLPLSNLSNDTPTAELCTSVHIIRRESKLNAKNWETTLCQRTTRPCATHLIEYCRRRIAALSVTTGLSLRLYFQNVRACHV